MLLKIRDILADEALSDEAIVTVIATGFEDESDPLYKSYDKPTEKVETLDDDDDLPPFLRNRDF